ncbi:aldose 1-epimerase [Burkholderia sp. Ac-20379]|nr:aldose 1-epimerase [Burkholderia sp. Ac-20379]
MGAIVLNCRPATPSSSRQSQAQGPAQPAAGPADSGLDPDLPILGDRALVVLRDGVRRVVVAPELGGSLAAFYDATPHGPVHWLRPAGRDALDAADPLRMASFPLFPYCNRIRDGRFRFDGRDWHVPMGEGALRHALHGHGWRLPWQVAARGEASVELRLDYEPAADAGTAANPGWPFRYAATQRIELRADGALSLEIAARNLDSRSMPFGFGHHPYYPRGAHTRLRTRVAAMWRSDADLLPVSLDAHPAVDALAQGVAVDALALDNNFTGWEREAVIDWPDERRRLTMRAEAPLDCFVLYSPPGEPVFCAEPVSNTTDWINLDAPAAARGGCVLAPGETVRATIVWLPETNL